MKEDFSRRRFVGVAGGTGLLAAGLAGADATEALAASADEGRPIGPQAGLRVLLAGNRRWVPGKHGPGAYPADRRAIEAGTIAAQSGDCRRALRNGQRRHQHHCLMLGWRFVSGDEAS
jgi:hypothetical protein